MATFRDSKRKSTTKQSLIRDDSTGRVLSSGDSNVHNSHFCYGFMGTGGIIVGVDSFGNMYRGIPTLSVCQVPTKDHPSPQA